MKFGILWTTLGAAIRSEVCIHHPFGLSKTQVLIFAVRIRSIPPQIRQVRQYKQSKFIDQILRMLGCESEAQNKIRKHWEPANSWKGIVCLSYYVGPSLLWRAVFPDSSPFRNFCDPSLLSVIGVRFFGERHFTSFIGGRYTKHNIFKYPILRRIILRMACWDGASSNQDSCIVSCMVPTSALLEVGKCPKMLLHVPMEW